VRETVVVGGAVGQRPGIGGHAWVILQYLIGFRRLGYDVLFLDREQGADASWLEYVLGLHGTPYLVVGEDGAARRHAVERLRDALFLFDVMGFMNDEELLAAVPRRVFFDIDPGFPQMWRELGLADVLSGYDAYVTVGTNIGRDSCSIPTCGLDWIATEQPVVLDEWPVSPEHGRRITTIATWRGPFAPVDYEGTTYGLRAHEFRKFVELPRRTADEFEVALDIDPADYRDVELLRKHGWGIVDPRHVAGDLGSYREYIQRSKAEFMVAKNIYVETRSGWFSDRSICYLASGTPVLAQETGFSELYPTGEGLLTYSTLEDTVAGVEEITRNYQRHCKAAREIAEEYFDSDKVLKRLLEKLGVG
jgi:hypothetical protein